MSILATAMVIYLFADTSIRLTNNVSAQPRGPSARPSFTKQNDEKEIMIMNPKRNSIAAWGFSTWFALLSPVIGILLGLFGGFLFLR